MSSPDSEWAFALFISKVCSHSCRFSSYNLKIQLPDPNARTFTPDILRRAMLDTIASLNVFAEVAGVTEVHILPNSSIKIDHFSAEPDEFLCHRWRHRHSDKVYIIGQR
jgi:hypothetical protein